jgi:transcriptional regulator with XRE-family HTH domain
MALTYDTPTGVSTGAKRAAGGPNSASVHFGRLVAARRLELGLSQEELARRMGTSQSRVRKIEEGEPLSAEGRERLTSALGIESETRPALERARMAPWKSTALAAATVAALWLSAVVVDAGWPRIGLAVAAVAALWLSVFLFERGASFRVPATAVTAVWILVIGVVLIFNGGAPGVSNGRFDGIGAAIAGPLPLQAEGDGADAVLSSSAIDNGQSGEAVSALQPVGLSHQVGRCDSPGAAEGGPASVLAVGIDPFPWTGALAIYSQNLVCGAQSGITFAGVTAAAAGEGVYTFSRGNSPAAGSQTDSPSASQAVSLSASKVGSLSASTVGSLSAGHSGSAGAVNSVGNTVTQPVSGGGGSVGNVVKPVGTVVKPGPVGNVVKPVGNAVKPVGNAVNAVGNAVNNSVGHVLKKP